MAKKDGGPHPQPLSQGERGEEGQVEGGADLQVEGGPHPQPLSQGERGEEGQVEGGADLQVEGGPHPQPLSQGERGEEQAARMAAKAGGELVRWRVEGNEVVALVDCGIGGIKKFRQVLGA